MKLERLKLFARATLMTLAIACASCDTSDFARFLKANQAYYADLANECDGLLDQGPIVGNTDAKQFARQTNSLPPRIRELRPSRIQITRDYVLVTLDTYLVVWTRSKADPVCGSLSQTGRV